MDGSDDTRMVFISHTHADGVFKVGSHHLAREFSRLGYDVLHMSTPFSSAHALLGKGSAGRREQSLQGPARDEDGVLHVVPATRLPAQFSSPRYIFNWLQKLGFSGSRFMLIDQPLMAAHSLSKASNTIVYRPTDLYPEGSGARKQRVGLRIADGVIATSAEVLASLNVPQGLPSVSIPNGVEFNRFSNDALSNRSGAVYVGAFDDRFDWDAVRAFALAVPEAPVRLAGPGSMTPADLPDNIELLGPVPYDSVPTLLSSARIGLLPFSDAVGNRGRSPMKLYEYLAAGLSVLSRSTPVIDSYHLPGVATYSSIASGSSHYRRLHDSYAVNLAGLGFARSQDWSQKARDVEAFLLKIEAAKSPSTS